MSVLKYVATLVDETFGDSFTSVVKAVDLDEAVHLACQAAYTSGLEVACIWCPIDQDAWTADVDLIDPDPCYLSQQFGLAS